MNTTDTTTPIAWAADTEPLDADPETGRWSTVIAALACGAAAVLLAVSPLLEHHTQPRQHQTPAGCHVGSGLCAYPPPGQTLVPELTPGPADTIRPTDLSELLGGHQ